MPDLRKLTEAVKGFFGKDGKLKLMVLLGIVGMLAILASQFLMGDKEDSTGPPPSVTEGNQALYTSEEYIAKTEEKLKALIIRIEGVGKAEVMVTLANSGEYVYAQEEKRNLDKNVEPGGEAGDKITSKENTQSSYILVESGYGSKEPLIRTQLEPKIQGVVIVCEGAGDVKVKQSLINVVTTTLNIPTTRVCVEKIAITE